MPRFALVPFALGLLAVVPAGPLSAAPATESPWNLAARFDFSGALGALDASDAKAPGAPAALRLARAAALLGTQPVTSANISSALDTARAVAADSGADADLRLAARFLEARILQQHLEPRSAENLAAARAIFREVAGSGSTNPLASHATVPLALSLLYDQPELPPAVRLASAEELVPLAAGHPAAERDLRFVLAQTRLGWGLDAPGAREHLRRVDAIGFSQLPRRLSVRVSLGIVAEETGELALAAGAYRAFLAEAGRDSRQEFVRARLADIDRRLASVPSPR